MKLYFYGYSHGTQIYDTIIEKKEAVILLNNQESQEEEEDNYIGFMIPNKEACLQFVRLTHDTWIIDIPIYRNNEYLQAKHAVIAHRVALDILENFFDAESKLFQLLDQELYKELFAHIKQQWHIEMENVKEDLS